MSFTIYSVRAVRAPPLPYDRGRRATRRFRRDPPRACVPNLRVPIYRMVLRKERTLRVPTTKVAHRDSAAEVAHALIGDSPYEKMVAILLDSQTKIVGAIIISTTSTISATAVSIRGVFAGAIAHNASAIILAHNHPSGAPEPSREDVEFSRKANEAAVILGIPIVDHLIVTMDPDVWSAISC